MDDKPKQCSKCAGCGQIANDEDESPWKYWAELTWPSNMSVVMGLVRPLACPKCNGTGGIIGAEESKRNNAVLSLIRGVAGGAMSVSVEDVFRVRQDIDAQHTVMPIIDPTKYREVAPDLSDNLALVSAFHTFRKELERIFEGAKARAER